MAGHVLNTTLARESEPIEVVLYVPLPDRIQLYLVKKTRWQHRFYPIEQKSWKQDLGNTLLWHLMVTFEPNIAV